MVDGFLFFGGLGNYVVLCLEGPWDCDCGPAFLDVSCYIGIQLLCHEFTNATGPCLRVAKND